MFKNNIVYGTISLIVISVILYGVSVFFIIPMYFKDNELKISSYVGYGLTILTSLAWVLIYLTRHF
jgi:hypothetical protein